MFSISKNVIPKNNTIKQIIPEDFGYHVAGIGFFARWVNANNLLPDLQYLCIRPLIDGTHTWPHRETINKHVDFVRFIPLKFIKRIQRGKLTLIFDAGNEAWDPINEIRFWDVINANCKRYNLPKKNVWYFSSNMKDKNNDFPCKFLRHCEYFWADDIVGDKSVDEAFEETVNATVKHYKNVHYYSSLSGRDKHERHKLHYLLWRNNLDTHGMISNTEMSLQHKNALQAEYSKYHVDRWSKTLPLFVDRTVATTKGWNFHDLEKDFHILDRSAFHIANETFMNPRFNVQLITEKTFKTFARFTPSIIFGHNDTTKVLKDMGFNDLSFKFGLPDGWDKHDFNDRLEHVLDAVEYTCDKLNTMTTAQIIDWKFAEESKLKENYKVLQTQNFNINYRMEFIKTVEE